MHQTRRPRVSVVAPCYNEAEGLRDFHRRASAAAQEACGADHEIVLVDDGSRDTTWEVISALATEDPRVVGVRLMRNHGHQLAVTAGLSLARGSRVLLIDADLQDPPELLPAMMRLMDEGAEVVYGQRTRRQAETLFKKATAAGFYRLLGRLSGTPIPRDTGDFRLMSRRVVDALSAMPERQRFIRGMVSWVGGRQVPLAYERQPRHAGESKYPLRKMVGFALDAITSFSTAPLRLASWLGLAAAMLALPLMLYTVVRWAQGGTVAGWSSTIAVIALFSAVQLIVLGILGEYVGRLFQEVKARPLFLVDTVLAGRSAHALPTEFSRLSPEVRRDLWEAIQGAGAANLNAPEESAEAHRT
jgi:polyisoprenyl-phosphate glycosyltransferase